MFSDVCIVVKLYLVYCCSWTE